eukprot:5296744-Pyramimonas_sp.AAC.1
MRQPPPVHPCWFFSSSSASLTVRTTSRQPAYHVTCIECLNSTRPSRCLSTLSPIPYLSGKATRSARRRVHCGAHALGGGYAV